MGLLEKAQKKRAKDSGAVIQADVPPKIIPAKKPEMYFSEEKAQSPSEETMQEQEPAQTAIQAGKPQEELQKEPQGELQENAPIQKNIPIKKNTPVQENAPKVRFIEPTTPKDIGAVGISLDTGKIEVHRSPDDVARQIERQAVEAPAHETPETAEIDMSFIREAIEKRLKEGRPVTPTPAQAAIIQKKPATINAPAPSLIGKRIASGIPGLDEVMEGGFKAGSVSLIGGGAGSGKSILCMQFLINGIENHSENGIYVSFEESEEKILEDFKRFGWELEEKIRNKQLTILYYTPEQVEKVLEAGGGIIRDVIESMNARRLIIDSLTAFTLLHETELAKRKAVLRLFDAVHSWGVTTLMTSEQEPDPERHVSTIMEFETDGVILLYNIRKGDIRERSLEIFKMRGVHHAAKIFPMKVDDNGITIFPEETVF